MPIVNRAIRERSLNTASWRSLRMLLAADVSDNAIRQCRLKAVDARIGHSRADEIHQAKAH
jgi:hypothetical protein